MHRKYVPRCSEGKLARAMSEGWLLRRHGYGPETDVLQSLTREAAPLNTMLQGFLTLCHPQLDLARTIMNFAACLKHTMFRML